MAGLQVVRHARCQSIYERLEAAEAANIAVVDCFEAFSFVMNGRIATNLHSFRAG